jgi:hypothetical protein
MEPTSRLNSLHAFDMLRQAAKEYSGAEYKFYQNGFFRYVNEGSTMLIEDMYIERELRGTPVSKLMVSAFNDFLDEQGIIFTYGYVMKNSDQCKKRLATFEKWGLKITHQTADWYVLGALVSDLGSW